MEKSRESELGTGTFHTRLVLDCEVEIMETCHLTDLLFAVEYFEGINDGKTDSFILCQASPHHCVQGLWYWLIAVTVSSLLASLGFVIMEIFRATKEEDDDERGRERNQATLNTIEGVCFFLLAGAWIPTVMVATTPGSPASLVGNAYFSTWLLVIFVFEGLVWYIHDMRKQIHKSLKQKQEEYRMKQQEVVDESKRIQLAASSHNEEENTANERSGSEYFDALDAF